MQFDPFEQAALLRRAGQPFVLATVVRAERPTSAKAGAKAIITPEGALTGWVGGSCAQPTVIREAVKALQDGQPRYLRLCPPEQLGRAAQDGIVEVALTCISGGTLEVYIEPHLPEPQLVAVGHLPITEALVTLGKGLGYGVAVMGLDASPERYPLADRVLNRVDFAGLLPERAAQTYVVVATHGNYDEEALEAALAYGAGYVALVASRRRAEAVLGYLRESGLPETVVAGVRCPAGLDLGAVTPEEIALSILAEIVQVRRRPTADIQSPISNLQSPITNSHPPLFTPPQPLEALDPVCGMTVEIATARYVSQHEGQTYYFCAAGCKRSFDKDPLKYLIQETADAARRHHEH
jgi:xanthine dehydrogenase accessory factor